MFRNIINQLDSWNQTPERKPLILQGARQVGKTWILKEFGRKRFLSQGHGVHYFDFQKQFYELNTLFNQTQDPTKLIKGLSLIVNSSINLDDLLVFDEAQNCPRAIESLKYFQQDLPKQVIICAGSHLNLLEDMVVLSDDGLAIKFSFPVGKVTFLEMFPMTFEEFLCAANPIAYEQLLEWEPGTPVLAPLHVLCKEYVQQYLITGGLPEVVYQWIHLDSEPIEKLPRISKIQQDILLGYESDFAKYSGRQNASSIQRLFLEAAIQLNKSQDGSSAKFIFKNFPSHLRRFEKLQGPLHWLSGARLLYKVGIVQNPELPLTAHSQDNQFKLYIFDNGILNLLLELPLKTLMQQNIGNYKGFMLENLVCQQLVAHGYNHPHCWKGATSEVEFLISTPDGIVPLEVKSSDRSKRSKSLLAYKEKYKPPIALKVSNQNYGSANGIHTIPLYGIGRYLSDRWKS